MQKKKANVIRDFIFRNLRRTVVIAGVVCLTIGCSDPVEVKNLKTIKNSIEIEFVLIPSGQFIMGEATREECTVCKASADETPRHPVTIKHSFYMSRHEVTQWQWVSVMKENPSRFRGKNRPVDTVSWYDVQLFIEELNTMEKKGSYRLPTEAEWEYAARAGTKTAYSYGDEPRKLAHYAWHGVNSGGKTHNVGGLKPNPWGLYDMNGNVFEWCSDWYRSDYYKRSPQIDPKGPISGSHKVRRGGSMDKSARRCRSSARAPFFPDQRSGNTGFRLVKVL